jgi:hypothetical protein
MSATDQDIIEARKKLAEKFANVKLGGKGKPLSFYYQKEHKRERPNPNTEQMQLLLIRRSNLSLRKHV